MISIAATLKEWEAAYAAYQRDLLGYLNTSKIRRFLGQLKEPKHPEFRSRVLISDYENSFVVELRCYDGLFLACRQGNQAYKLDLQTGDKTPMLGARGMNIEPEYVAIINNLANDIYEIANNYNLKEFTFYQDYENMINSCEEGYYL